jgi:hypothetical protein
MATDDHTPAQGEGNACRCITDSDFNEFASRLRSLVATARLVNGMIDEVAKNAALQSIFTSSEFLLVEVEKEIDTMEQKLIDKQGACGNG